MPKKNVITMTQAQYNGYLEAAGSHEKAIQMINEVGNYFRLVTNVLVNGKEMGEEVNADELTKNNWEKSL
jgi:hypothetical protein